MIKKHIIVYSFDYTPKQNSVEKINSADIIQTLSHIHNPTSTIQNSKKNKAPSLQFTSVFVQVHMHTVLLLTLLIK